MPAVAELRGLWQRSLIVLPDGSRDTTTEVRWLQGLRAYADLRRPSPIPDYSHVSKLADLTQHDCLRLADQQGFRDADAPTEPAAGALLRDSRTGSQAMLVRVGEHFMFARDRPVSQPPLTSPPPGQTLRDCVAAASSLRECQALVDCEISFGTATGLAFHITASTLPYRIGDMLTLDPRWDVVQSEGDQAALSPPGIHSLRAQ